MNYFKFSLVSLLTLFNFVSAYSVEISSVEVVLTSYESDTIYRPVIYEPNFIPADMRIVNRVSFSFSGTNKKVIIPNAYGTTEELTLSIEEKDGTLSIQSRVLDELDNKELINSSGPFSIPISSEKSVTLHAKYGIKYLNKLPTPGTSIFTIKINKRIPK